MGNLSLVQSLESREVLRATEDSRLSKRCKRTTVYYLLKNAIYNIKGNHFKRATPGTNFISFSPGA